MREGIPNEITRDYFDGIFRRCHCYTLSGKSCCRKLLKNMERCVFHIRYSRIQIIIYSSHGSSNLHTHEHFKSIQIDAVAAPAVKSPRSVEYNIERLGNVYVCVCVSPAAATLAKR